MGALGLRTDPVLDRGAAHGGDEETHGLLQLAVEVSAEEIRGGAEVGQVLRGAEFPRAPRLLVAFARAAGALHEHAELRMVRGGLLVLEGTQPAHRPGHVRLARAQPHFADEHVLDRDRVAALHRHAGAFAGLQRIELHAPLALLIRFRRLRLAGDRHRDLLPRSRPAPDRNRGTGLENHMVRKRRGQSDLGVRGRGESQGDEERNRFHGWGWGSGRIIYPFKSRGSGGGA